MTIINKANETNKVGYQMVSLCTVVLLTCDCAGTETSLLHYFARSGWICLFFQMSVYSNTRENIANHLAYKKYQNNGFEITVSPSKNFCSQLNFG